MPRYIDKDTLIDSMWEAVAKVRDSSILTDDIIIDVITALIGSIDIIKSAPVSDVEQVRHGHWIVSNKSEWSQCSVCKRHFLYVWDWKNADERCRHCGAKMDEHLEVQDDDSQRTP